MSQNTNKLVLIYFQTHAHMIAMPQFKFVTVQGGDEKSYMVSSSTRSHAIRAGLKRTTRRSRRRATATFLGSTGFQQDGLQGLGLTLESVCPSCVDPFNSLPVPTNLQVDHLVKYLLSKYDSGLDASDRSRAWFPYALQSVPMMHSTLAMAATLWRAECPSLEQSIQVEGLHQKGEAMREIGSRLAQNHGIQHHEMAFLMSTMATLAIAEVCGGGFDAAEMHLKGVSNLFRLRGGYNSFKDQFILCKSINLADIQVATALGKGLIFPLMQTDQPQLLPTILEHTFDPPLHHSVANGSHYCSWIFTQLRQLLLATHSSTISVDDQRTLLNIVDYSTLRHLYTGFTDISYTGRRSRALVLAAQVFMYLTLRQVPPRSPLVCRMCDRLRRMVEVDQPGGIWADHREALLWVAFIGLLGTEGCLEGQWFLRLFKSTVQALQKEGFSGNNGMVGIFSAFLWDETLCPQLLARLGIVMDPRL